MSLHSTVALAPQVTVVQAPPSPAVAPSQPAPPAAAPSQPSPGWSESQLAFHLREAEKYEKRAQEREAKGRTAAAARARTVADRNRAKVAKYQERAEADALGRPSPSGQAPEIAVDDAAVAVADQATNPAAPITAAARARGDLGLAEQIGQLAALHASGALSDAEFAAAKARLLG